MSQPAFAVVCDNCLESAVDWYAIGHKWICAGCWDPFGTLPDEGISPSRNIAQADECATIGGKTRTVPTPLETTKGPNRSTSTGTSRRYRAMTHPTHTPPPPSPSRPHSAPVSLGEALPDVLAEMRRLQREREAR